MATPAPSSHEMPGGLMGELGGHAAPASEGDDPYSYFVDIDRENKPGGGWTKKVHRYKEKKK